ncbi:aliphatic sulfonate ABC transporter substrate-binding protein [Synechococcus elongatus]|uniref:Putative aliphatic sulfonates-binding protein n=1 Tax=Synechococcus elongatus PCC 11801 TaxID=2219813 RepID=A0AAN1UV18_SYNEL|nr:aliphatic sulfonate ABC transporter substrate-binding protein [Synechococcus elongatus]AZB73288.1 aliphatic sulfonate ABC transporter substrate-binding protein [Synechococcus elongatus PCC 11801]
MALKTALGRRKVKALLAGVAVAATATTAVTVFGNSAPVTAKPEEKVQVRIGFQKAGPVLISVNAKKTLEKTLKKTGSSATWSEFTAGLPMVEALNAGAIDIAYVGEAPPIFAQAASGSVTRYVAYDPFGPKAEGILVHRNSPIKKLSDLKGKRIAVQKGSNTHYLLISALKSANLKPSDVKISYLKPSDGRAAFERRDVDAWVVWDPFLAAGEVEAGGRLLTNAQGLAPNRGYYLASASFIKKYPETLKTVLKEFKQEAQLLNKDKTKAANLLSSATGISPKTLLIAENRRTHDVLPITNPVIQKQQEIADTFRALNLIPKSIKVKDAVWIWK